MLEDFASEQRDIHHAVNTIPLPIVLDTRVRLPSVPFLQGDSEEDVILTFQVTCTFFFLVSPTYSLQYFSSFLLPLKVSQEELTDFFFPKDRPYSHLKAPKFGGDAFGKHMVKLITTKMPKNIEISRASNGEEYQVLPFLDSLFEFCLPFTAVLTDLHTYNPELAAELLESSVVASGEHAPIMCHSLFTCWSVTSPLVVALVGIIKKRKVKICQHCAIDIQDYVLFVKTSPLSGFTASIRERSRIKSGGDNVACRIDQLEPLNPRSMAYDAALLEEAFLKERQEAYVLKAPTNDEHLIQDVSNLNVGNRIKDNHIKPIFSYKVHW